MSLLILILHGEMMQTLPFKQSQRSLGLDPNASKGICASHPHYLKWLQFLDRLENVMGIFFKKKNSSFVIKKPCAYLFRYRWFQSGSQLACSRYIRKWHCKSIATVFVESPSWIRKADQCKSRNHLTDAPLRKSPGTSNLGQNIHCHPSNCRSMYGRGLKHSQAAILLVLKST